MQETQDVSSPDCGVQSTYIQPKVIPHVSWQQRELLNKHLGTEYPDPGTDKQQQLACAAALSVEVANWLTAYHPHFQIEQTTELDAITVSFDVGSVSRQRIVDVLSCIHALTFHYEDGADTYSALRLVRSAFDAGDAMAVLGVLSECVLEAVFETVPAVEVSTDVGDVTPVADDVLDAFAREQRIAKVAEDAAIAEREAQVAVTAAEIRLEAKRLVESAQPAPVTSASARGCTPHFQAMDDAGYQGDPDYPPQFQAIADSFVEYHNAENREESVLRKIWQVSIDEQKANGIRGADRVVGAYDEDMSMSPDAHFQAEVAAIQEFKDQQAEDAPSRVAGIPRKLWHVSSDEPISPAEFAKVAYAAAEQAAETKRQQDAARAKAASTMWVDVRKSPLVDELRARYASVTHALSEEELLALQLSEHVSLMEDESKRKAALARLETALKTYSAGDARALTPDEPEAVARAELRNQYAKAAKEVLAVECNRDASQCESELEALYLTLLLEPHTEQVAQQRPQSYWHAHQRLHQLVRSMPVDKLERIALVLTRTSWVDKDVGVLRFYLPVLRRPNLIGDDAWNFVHKGFTIRRDGSYEGAFRDGVDSPDGTYPELGIYDMTAEDWVIVTLPAEVRSKSASALNPSKPAVLRSGLSFEDADAFCEKYSTLACGISKGMRNDAMYLRDADGTYHNCEFDRTSGVYVKTGIQEHDFSAYCKTTREWTVLERPTRTAKLEVIADKNDSVEVR